MLSPFLVDVKGPGLELRLGDTALRLQDAGQVRHPDIARFVT